MLACFGVSGPVAVLKTWRTKAVSGKSLLFLWLILAGYVCGVLFKVASGLDWVIALYGANLGLVTLDIALYYRYRGRKAAEATKGQP